MWHTHIYTVNVWDPFLLIGVPISVTQTPCETFSTLNVMAMILNNSGSTHKALSNGVPQIEIY